MVDVKDREVALSLCAAAESFVGGTPTPLRWLEGGYEALVLKAEGRQGAIVLHVSSSQRSREELSWCHAVARHAHKAVPQVVVPIERDGDTLAEWHDRLLAVYPFVDGSTLDHNDPSLRNEAARLLAKLHRGLLDWSGGPRPSGTWEMALAELPVSLRDDHLDAWWNAAEAEGVVTSVIHGDYYRRNILCAGGTIAGVIDWHDAETAPLTLELAGAVFELCREGELVPKVTLARDFIGAYRDSDGPVPEQEIASLARYMRLWIRRNVVKSLSVGGDELDPYMQQQINAFRHLATAEWKP